MTSKKFTPKHKCSITERKQAEDALRDSKELFSLFMRHSPIYAFIKEVTPGESRVLQASKNYLDMIGISGQDMIGKDMTDLFPPESAAKFIADDWDVISNGKVLKIDEDLNGRHYTSIKFPIVQGGKTLLAGYTIDITERVRAEQALRVSEEKFRTVANFTYDWEMWRGPDGAYLYVSPSCERVTGYSAAEFLTDSNFVLKITHPEDLHKVSEHYETAADQSKELDIHLDFRIVTLDGKVRWIGHSCTAVFGEGGQWLGRRESNRDITERKLAEAKLIESESYLRNIIENEPECIKIVDAHGRLILMNPAGLAMIEADCLEQVVGRPILDILAPEYRMDFADLHRRVLKGETMRMEFEVLGFKGGRRWLETHAVPMQYHGETVLLAITRDVTERKLAVDELHRAKEALTAANIELQTALIREHQLAHTDALTGINNRRHLYELAEHEFEIATRYQQPLSVIMFDIDHFKEVNDTFGHSAGDQMLQYVTQVACAELRSSDVIGRYGGEEFVIVLPMTNAQQAYPLAERIRMGVEQIRVFTENGDAAVTLSIGIVEIFHGAQNGSAENLIRHADKAMYAAKLAGRNRTEIGDSK